MGFTTKNKYGINHRQWLFAEEYILHFNADEAYRKVYSSSQTRNAWIILRSRPLIAYIRMRLEEKQATLDRNWELANRKLQEIMESGSSSEALQAAKIASENRNKQREMESKLKELEGTKEVAGEATKNITINISTVEKTSIDG
jgi:hypothetical protein